MAARGSGGLRIGSVFGISIYVHPSWLIIFILITTTLVAQFSQAHPHWTAAQHWALAIITSILFFGSVLFHELSHSIVARHYKIPVASITLFVFGGLAQISREPESASQEFLIAFAGPLSSYVLAAAFYGLMLAAPHNEMVTALAGWLAVINFSLATFNLVPGFPLDGGRVLRAAAWGVTRDFAKATRIASGAGRLIAYAMILYGAWDAFHGNWVGGIWTAFIGWFLLSAAQESYGQIAVRQALMGLRASDVMSLDLPAVPRDISLEDYGQEVLRTGRRCHLVVTQGTLNGLMTVHMLNKFPRDEWASNSVQAAMLPLARMSWAAPDEPVLKILERMRAEDVNQMPVLQKEPSPHVVGMVTRENILHVIQTRTELGSLTHA
ncbi:MAG TPA: site-2 protease family protein [Candidatus Acidoferrales bacterium]|nr:site-2 protease family protein [Candidatus Acidoferrales bacterium]